MGITYKAECDHDHSQITCRRYRPLLADTPSSPPSSPFCAAHIQTKCRQSIVALAPSWKALLTSLLLTSRPRSTCRGESASGIASRQTRSLFRVLQLLRLVISSISFMLHPSSFILSFGFRFHFCVFSAQHQSITSHSSCRDSLTFSQYCYTNSLTCRFPLSQPYFHLCVVCIFCIS